MNILVFDIETVPDTRSGSLIYDLQGLSEEDIGKAMFAKRIQKTSGSDFLALHLHRIVAISAVLRSGDSIKVWSLGDLASSEKELITRFYDGIDRYSPTLVSWNGGGFDLPILHYRSLIQNVSASRYWDNGDDDREFKFNNYLNRFHWRHIDLMDVLAGFNPRGSAPLNEIAIMLDFPGKLGMSGEHVWQTYLNGGLKAIRQYCETDVLNTYLVYLRWELIRGNFSDELYKQECEKVKELLKVSKQPHFDEFLDVWETQSANSA